MIFNYKLEIIMQLLIKFDFFFVFLKIEVLFFNFFYFFIFIHLIYIFFKFLRWEINYVIVITYYKIKKNMKQIWYFLYLIISIFKFKKNSYLQIQRIILL